MLWEGMIHISGIANPHIQDQRIANPLGRGLLFGTLISLMEMLVVTDRSWNLLVIFIIKWAFCGKNDGYEKNVFNISLFFYCV